MCYQLLKKAGIIAGLFFLFQIPSLFSQTKPIGHISNVIAKAKADNEVFSPISIFQKETASISDKNVQTAVSEATFMTLNTASNKSLMDAGPSAIELSLPYKNGNIELELIKVNILAEDFTVVTNESNGQPVSYTPGAFYRGILKGNPQSVATFSVFENEVFGMVSYAEVGTLVLGRLEKEGNKDEYILYADKDLLYKPEFKCDADLLPEPDIQIPKKQGGEKSMVLPHCVRQFLEADYALYQDKGTVTATVNWLTSMFAEVDVLYDNDFSGDGLTIEISQIYVWVSQDNYSTSSSSSALNTFVANRGTFTGDLAMLCALGGNNIGGLAYRPGICGTPYGYSNINASYSSVPTYSWTVEVMAHELGHNHGSPHTHACVWGVDRDRPVDCCGPNAGYNDASCGGNCSNPIGPEGTIMSYCHLSPNGGIDFNLGFGSEVADTIRHYHNNIFGCLSACPTYSCGAPTGITITGIGSTESTINWTAVGGASSYNVQYKLNNAASWTTVNTTNTSYTMTGLNTGVSYIAQVQTDCGGSTSAYATGAIFTTVLNCPPAASTTQSSENPVCDGENFTLSLSESYSSGYTFQWQSSPTNSSYTNISGATSSTYVANQSSATWYRCQVTCASQNITSTALQVTMETNPSECVCTPGTTNCSGGDRINRVQLGILDNQNNTCSSGGYGDYTSGHSVPNLYIGSGDYGIFTYEFFQQRATIFIDFNQDGDMDDANEEIQIPYTTALTQASVINVPNSAATGNTTMRIRSRYWGDGYPTNSCDGYNWGETEDYTINIVNCPSTCYELPQITQCSNFSPDPYMRINRVQLGTLDNVGNSCTDYTGFEDYTSGQTVPDLPQSSSPTITVTVNDYAQRISVFIDFNNNGSFADAGEEFQLPYTGSQTNTGTITVPGGATIGNTTMRVRSRWEGDGLYPPDAYTGLFWGESEDYTVNISSALPVELVDFRANLTNENTTDLNWTTASELNASHFVVERSNDGVNFHSLAEKAAAGNSATNLYYNLVDKNPFPGTSYYRLRMVDLDGTEDFSPVRSIYLMSNKFEVLSIFPNPSKENVHVKYHVEKDRPVQFELTDVTGKSILFFEKNAIQGENAALVEVTDLAPGIYFLTVFDGISSITERVVKY